jgi:hypothetical protein
MIDAEQFSIGLSVVALAVRETVDAATFAVYHQLLAGETTAEEWPQFTQHMARRAPRSADGRPRFPTAPEMLDALSEFRGHPALPAEAAEAYARVLAASNWTPEGGASWNFRDVRERCGAAAARAFLEAGGHHAFATAWDEPKRRERFLAAYQSEARERPSARLLPAGPTRALPAGEPEMLSEAEAAALLERLRVATVAPAPRARLGDGMARATDERLALLKAQAAEIMAGAAEEA